MRWSTRRPIRARRRRPWPGWRSAARSTLTSTYDHRIIQGAQSGEFLQRIHQLLLGEDGFYDDIFTALQIPYEPVRWVRDIAAGHEKDITKPARVQELIHAYRVRGHLMADTNPLEFPQRKHPDLDINQHGLTLWDLEREFATGGFGGQPLMKLRKILGVLRDSYCRTVGVEYMHIQEPDERAWIQARIERPHERPGHDEQIRILSRLNVAEAFEMFLQTKFVGQRRFSLEGAESLIPLLDAVITEAAEAELDEAVLGMAHRGRLNVLANIVGKSYGQIFNEFEGNMDPRSTHGSGDVKYHLGADGTFKTTDGAEIPTSLVANPSHLEAGDPVLEGVVRAKQDVLDKGGEGGFTVLPILMHGDAAFAGQGVVAETLNLSQLRGYRTGGTVHIVINNQLGFTTGPKSGRSSVYATDVARMIQAPIFHVNGDDPEAVVRVGRLAFEYRQSFHKDVVIDMVCYRRRGHNEADNPSFTQPLMYDLIEAKRSTRKLYTESLIGRGDITMEEAEAALRDYQRQLERAFTETREAVQRPPEPGAVVRPEPEGRPVNHTAVATAISADAIKQVIETQVSMPDGFTPHPRLQPQLARRAAMVAEDTIDWATGELLAFGGLLLDGRPVRLVGQDSRRGTFGQRHAVVVDRRNGNEYTPLKRFDSGSSKFYVYDSLLSEFAAVGFEYGYSVARPDALVCWEAQFGDFFNGAQSIIDEFISAGEQKWGQHSGVVLLLPHGYEGQGPDHSSARIERFLTLCAQDNMTVAQPTTPANYFHLLRWQGMSGQAQAADRLHAEVDAPAEGGDVPGVGLHQRVVPAADRGGAGVRRGAGTQGAALLGQDLLGSDRTAAGRRLAHRDRPGRAALPDPAERAQGRAVPLPGGGGTGLGPGGAGEHGGLAADGADAARTAGPQAGACVAAAELGPGDRLGQAARRDTQGTDRGGPQLTAGGTESRCTSPTVA